MHKLVLSIITIIIIVIIMIVIMIVIIIIIIITELTATTTTGEMVALRLMVLSHSPVPVVVLTQAGELLLTRAVIYILEVVVVVFTSAL